MVQNKWCPIRDDICAHHCAWKDEDGGCLVARVMMAYSAKKLAPAIEENKDIPIPLNPYDTFYSLFVDPNSKNTNGGSQI